MKEERFSLLPFSRDAFLSDIKITGSMSLHARTLAVNYELKGPLGELVIPGPERTPVRRHRLWESTCFEFFIRAGNTGAYREFNCSPSGCWNVYSFKGYRQEMQEELLFSSLPFSVSRHSDMLRLELELDLGTIVPVQKALKAAVSAVIKHVSGDLSYWALIHTGPQPDFHRQDGFTIELS